MNKQTINQLKELVINNYSLVTRRDLKGKSIYDYEGAIESINESFDIFEERLGKLKPNFNTSIKVPYIEIVNIEIHYNGEITIDSSWSNQSITDEWLNMVMKIKTIINENK